MKAPKNFYNTVDQTKLGIDDLFTRTAENEADIAALETVVGDDTAGLVKSVNDLETVVGDLDGGLVKDVHDLQDDSEQYHDDIADLKNADILINNRIDGHLLAETTTSADEGKIMSVDNTGAWALTAIAGGGDVVVFEVKATSGGNKLTLQNNKTMADVAAVLNSNKMPVFYIAAAKQFYYPAVIPNYIMLYNITFDNSRNVVIKVWRLELTKLTISYNEFENPAEYTFNHV